MSFLSLPPKIREEIYLYAGVIHAAEIHFLEQTRPTYRYRLPLSYQVPNDLSMISLNVQYVKASFEASYNLLSTCTTLYSEVSSLLYSTNRFIFSVRSPHHFQVLQNLRPRTVSRLQRLTIVINHGGCRICPPDTPPCHNDCRPFSDGAIQADPIDCSDPCHQILLCEWDCAITHVLKNARPHYLALHVTCDCIDYKAAARVLEPLVRARDLADCSVRLGRQPGQALQTLARNIVLSATSTKILHDGPFRFLDLPRELRSRVLEYTDLVTPLKEVEWSPHGFTVRYANPWCARPHHCAPPFHHVCQFRDCWESQGNSGCFCHRYHAAFDFRCNCWRPPQPLFLVCRSIHEDAERVFFRSNRFIVKPVDECKMSPQRTPCCLEAALFLTQAVRPSALCHLRYLEIVFPPFEDRYCLEGATALSHWRQTLKLIRDKLCHPMLTLHIYMPNHHACGFRVSAYRRELSKDQGVAMLRTYLRILEPLSEWLGVKRLYLDIAWPWSWTAFGCDKRGDIEDFMQDKNRWTTDQIGEAILGKDYERLNQGKDDLIPAQWRAIEFVELHEGLFEYNSPRSDPALMDARWKEILEDESLTLTRLFREE